MGKIDRKKLGQAIKQLRESKDISQEILAQTLDIPRPSVAQLEKGARDLSVSELDLLLQTFQISYQELMNLLKPQRELGRGHAEISPQGRNERQGGKDGNSRNEKKKIKITFYPEKFKQLLLYILQKCGSKPNVGETVLYKLLYFCDFDYFELHEKPLTGIPYKCLQYGPVPDQSKYLHILSEMREKGQLERISRPYAGQTLQTKYIAFQEADINTFSSEEMNVIDKVINRLSDMSARQIEAHVHNDYPWKSHQEGEIIDYASVFSREGEFAQRDYEAEFLQASANDTLKELGEMSEEEYQYYLNLPPSK